MIGYTLRLDGHPLGYLLYDCDLGTTIKRTDDLVTFNVDMSTLKFIAERSVQRPVDLYRNAIVAKFFNAKNKPKQAVLHWGKVISHTYDKDGELLFRIHYEDGDSEDFNLTEMTVHTRLTAKNNRKSNFTVPHAPKSRTKRKLSQLLQHTQNITLSSNSHSTSERNGHPPGAYPPCDTPRKLSVTIGNDNNAQATRRSTHNTKVPDRFTASTVLTSERNDSLHNFRPLRWSDLLKPRSPNVKT